MSHWLLLCSNCANIQKDFVNTMIDMKNIVIHAKKWLCLFFALSVANQQHLQHLKIKIILNQMVKCLFLATTYLHSCRDFPTL
ncbi:hypothetical protein LFZ20_03440 [Salmonella enterica subsp. enterica serovar Johannesburg str. SA20025782]|nr:hypothetical protein LFZ20_03440 [Salmonella enterica subsp. enterica serovar Johannesburg str. SA20025782]